MEKSQETGNSLENIDINRVKKIFFSPYRGKVFDKKEFPELEELFDIGFNSAGSFGVCEVEVTENNIDVIYTSVAGEPHTERVDGSEINKEMFDKIKQKINEPDVRKSIISYEY